MLRHEIEDELVVGGGAEFVSLGEIHLEEMTPYGFPERRRAIRIDHAAQLRNDLAAETLGLCRHQHIAVLRQRAADARGAMLGAHEQRPDLAAAGEVIDADEHAHVEAAVHNIGGLRLGEHAKIEERRHFANRGLYTATPRQRAALDVFKRDEIALGARNVRRRGKALLRKRQLCRHRFVVEHETGETSAGDFTQLLETFKVGRPRGAHDIAWRAHERRLRTSNTPRSTPANNKNESLARSAKLEITANSSSL